MPNDTEKYRKIFERMSSDEIAVNIGDSPRIARTLADPIYLLSLR